MDLEEGAGLLIKQLPVIHKRLLITRNVLKSWLLLVALPDVLQVVLLPSQVSYGIIKISLKTWDEANKDS